jgi:hypothetical protein
MKRETRSNKSLHATPDGAFSSTIVDGSHRPGVREFYR